MSSQRTGGGNVDRSWSAWYFVARDEMAFRYGIRRIPKDRYKEQHALGRPPRDAAREIYRQMQAEGSRCLR